MDPGTLDMIARTHNEEKVQLRMRIAALEREIATLKIEKTDLLNFVGRIATDAMSKSNAHGLRPFGQK